MYTSHCPACLAGHWEQLKLVTPTPYDLLSNAPKLVLSILNLLTRDTLVFVSEAALALPLSEARALYPAQFAALMDVGNPAVTFPALLARVVAPPLSLVMMAVMILHLHPSVFRFKDSAAGAEAFLGGLVDAGADLTVSGQPGCPNVSNRNHACTAYCRERWGTGMNVFHIAAGLGNRIAIKVFADSLLTSGRGEELRVLLRCPAVVYEALHYVEPTFEDRDVLRPTEVARYK